MDNGMSLIQQDYKQQRDDHSSSPLNLKRFPTTKTNTDVNTLNVILGTSNKQTNKRLWILGYVISLILCFVFDYLPYSIDGNAIRDEIT